MTIPGRDAALLSVKNLRTFFETGDGIVKAVDGVSFTVDRGETLGIVGESGSGKSVAILSILRLIAGPPGRIEGGEIVFDGIRIRELPIGEMRALRGRRIAMIFQDPMTSLNPFLKISTQLMEVTRLHLGHSKKQAYDHAVNMLETVGIPDAEQRMQGYPHELSGGMCQRVMIAMALSCDPELLIADEPTTALDVTIQAQILDLIEDLKERMGTSVILVTHDLGVIAGMTEKVVVMYAGMVFEQASTKDLFATPANPYTKGLLKSVRDPAHEDGTAIYQIPGSPPDVAHLPPGCPFAERCYRAEDICRRDFPPFVQINEYHHSLCHFAVEVYAESREENAVERSKHFGEAEEIIGV